MSETADLHETLTCPKCGFVQEERSDCRKCGVVFSKYYALYPSTRPEAIASVASPGTAAQIDRSQKLAISDLQMQIRELNARFAEVEFEKAERIQLRADLKNLEKKLREALEETAARLEQWQHQIDGFCISKAHLETLDFNLAAVMERLEQLEVRMKMLESATGHEDDFAGHESHYSRLLSELQQQLLSLKMEVSEIKSQYHTTGQISGTEQARSALEEDVHAIRGDLDELRKIFGTIVMK